MKEFTLHATLSEDCFFLGDFPLCRLLMMNDSQYPWFILVPRRANISESHELSTENQLQLSKESNFCAELIKRTFDAHKMNIAALGNVVPQLHIHHIARFESDIAWPKPIWGHASPVAFEKDQLLSRIETLQKALKENTEPHFQWDEQWV